MGNLARQAHSEGPLLSLLLSYTDLGLSLYFGSVTKFA